MQKINTHKMVFLALMIALDIVLTRFPFVNTPILRIGFGFLPVAVTGVVFGPVSAGLAAAAADIIGVTLLAPWPIHLGITLTAFLTGATYGLFLHKRINNFRIAAATLIVTVVLGLGVQTFWISGIQGVPYFSLIPPRTVQTLIMLPLQFVTLKIFAAHMPRLARFLPGECSR